MVVCNACHTPCIWHGRTLCNEDGTIHRCLKGKNCFIHNHKIHKWILDGEEPDETIPYQVRLEHGMWTMYNFGKVYAEVQKGEKEQ